MAISYSGDTVNVLAGSTEDGANSATVDMIALHGLGGHWSETWTSYDYCWLSGALTERFPFVRIVSLNQPFLLRDLAADNVDVASLTLDLIRNRKETNRLDKPILFLGHSFGGTLLKQIFIATHHTSTSNSDYLRLHQSIRGFVYLGTPHQDIHPPDVSQVWRALNAGATNSLNGGSRELNRALISTSRINMAFKRLEGEELPSICFYETGKSLLGASQPELITQAEATMRSDQTEAIPLNVKHQSLARYDDERDNDLLRILHSLESLMTAIPRPRAPRIESTSTRQPHVRLLSLDGGGIKGLFAALVIKRLIEEVQSLEGSSSSRKHPCDYFDLIGGTSTGGLLAIMLGRLDMDINTCIATYRSLARKIFDQSSMFQFLRPLHTLSSLALGRPWFSGDVLKTCICETINQNLGANEQRILRSSNQGIEEVKLVAPEIQASRCFVCAVPANERKVQRIRSYQTNRSTTRDTSSYTIWEAARATSAAPLYFPHINIGGTDYFDGGLDSNNPVVEVIEEARLEFPDAVIDTVVSIGTGQGTIVNPLPPFTNVVKHLAQRAVDTEGQHQRVMEEPTFEDVRRNGYYRFQGGTDLGGIDLSNVDKLDEVERITMKYLDSPAGRHKIASCAAKLVGR